MTRYRWMAVLATLMLLLVACGEEGEGANETQDDEPVAAAPADGECEEGAVIESETGLTYEEVECGDGDEAARGDSVTVKYVGKLENGEEFDSGTLPPFQLGTGGVIAGFDEGLTGMSVGGKRILTIPPELGYGPQGSPPVIPPNATLIFDVELLEVAKG
ncbi:MAG TPA: FKBP-type peptidyl-prolyl cis-trans isomerase [Actinomycetota bacterium]|nr:FKBP-type peptidyl-prolyl cis-trans isomerase [Actinomycetota bacterium]